MNKKSLLKLIEMLKTLDCPSNYQCLSDMQESWQEELNLDIADIDDHWALGAAAEEYWNEYYA